MMDFYVRGQPILRYSAFVKHLRKVGIYLLLTNFMIAYYYSVRRKVLCNTLTEFGTYMKQIRLIKMYLNETYTKA
jgi:hypothetical protein